MKICFRLGWIHAACPGRQSFKDKNASALFAEYVERISRFCPCESGGWDGKHPAAKPAKKIWVCERKGKEISSEELAGKLQQALNGGTRELEIVIGGPDGFKAEEMEKLRPDFLWSFGRLTLAHELAAIVAGEQIYRAWSILRNMPYHTGH